MGDRRRLLNRLQYQAVVEAKRSQGAAVIGDRSETTGKYEASEPDGSKVFGVKIDNSQPDGNAVRSLKGDGGQLYLQGQTAAPKPKLGEEEDEAIAGKGSPLETIISPLSNGADSFAAIDIGNKKTVGDTIKSLLPSHLGNELGYFRGQIWDGSSEEVKATYAYLYAPNVDGLPGRNAFSEFRIKFEFVADFVFVDFIDDPYWLDPFTAIGVNNFFLLTATSAVIVVFIIQDRLISPGNIETKHAYYCYYVSGSDSTLIATHPLIDQDVDFSDPLLLPEYQQYAQCIPKRLFRQQQHRTPIYNNFIKPPVDAVSLETEFKPPTIDGFKITPDTILLDSNTNLTDPLTGYFSYIKDSDDSTFPTEHYIYRVDYSELTGEFSTAFKKVKIVNYESLEQSNYPKFLIYKTNA